jgi:hypothetical protein
MSQKSRSPVRRMMRTCRSKKTFETVKDAAIQIAADWVNNGRIGLSTYECEVCGKFHNGRKA